MRVWLNPDDANKFVPDLQNRGPVRHRGYHLPEELIEEMDKVRHELRYDFPEMAAYPSWFVETALRYFLRELPKLIK